MEDHIESYEIFNVHPFRMNLFRKMFWVDFLLVDGKKQDACRMIEARGFTMHIKGAYAHNKWPDYILLSCTMTKKRFNALMGIMHDINDKMLILGYRDYKSACDHVLQ